MCANCIPVAQISDTLETYEIKEVCEVVIPSSCHREGNENLRQSWCCVYKSPWYY